jgi:hypothetical protein
MAFEQLGRMVKQVKPRLAKATMLRNINEQARDGLLGLPRHTNALLVEIGVFTYHPTRL